jgi:GR25 family glycosyltransferase involved in LPS biosynthesis
MVLVYYINVSHRKDRREHMEKELERMGLSATRYEAIYHPENPILGCTMSHMGVLKDALDREIMEPILVLEDDVKFIISQEDLTTLFEYIPSVCDVFMLGYGQEMVGTPITTFYGRVHSAHNAHAYIVFPHYLGRLHANLSEAATLAKQFKYPDYHWIYSHDQYWKRLQSTDTWYYTMPLYVKQIESYSDISLRVITRT